MPWIRATAVVGASCSTHWPNDRQREGVVRRRLSVFCLLAIPSLVWGADAEWRPIGPGGGAVRHIASGPPGTDLVVATTSGGVFRSQDYGQSWRYSGLSGLQPRVAAISPSDPTKIFAGTSAHGVYRSLDGGSTWVPPLGTDPLLAAVNSVAVDPLNADVAWAGGVGLFKSSDGGGHWGYRAFNTAVAAITYDPTDPTTIFVSVADRATAYERGGMFRSTDGGITWTPIREGTLRYYSDGTNYYPFVLEFAVCQGDSQTVYALTDREILKTSDAGDHWQSVSGLPPFAYGSYLKGIVVEANNCDAVYVATSAQGVWKTGNGGASWSPARVGLECGQCYSDGVCDPENENYSPINALAAAAGQPGRLVAGTSYLGAFISSDGAASWQPANMGLTATSVQAIALQPESTTVFAGVEGGGVLRSADGGLTWSLANAGIGDPCGPNPFGPTGFEVNCLDISTIASPRGLPVIYAAAQCGVFTSWDRGGTWSRWPNGEINRPGALAVDPSDARVVYTDGFRSTDAGQMWTRCGPLPDNRYAVVLAVDPFERTTLYAAANGGKVVISRDGCASWGDVTLDLETRCSGGPKAVWAITPHPRLQNTVYAATSCGVFVSRDRGGTWGLLGLEGTEVRDLLVDARQPATFYAGTGGSGVQWSRDGGTTWAHFGTGIEGLTVNAIALDPVTYKLLAGTDDRGIFSLDLARSPRLRLRRAEPPGLAPVVRVDASRRRSGTS